MTEGATLVSKFIALQHFLSFHGVVRWLFAITPIVSAGIAITALWITTSTARSTAREAKERSAREAHAVAYAVVSSIVRVSISARQMQDEINAIRRARSNFFGRSQAASIGTLNVEMPPMLERYLERLGALPEAATRECLVLTNMLMASISQITRVVNRVGVSDPMKWQAEIDLRIMTLDGIAVQADRTTTGLSKVIGNHLAMDDSGNVFCMTEKPGA